MMFTQVYFHRVRQALDHHVDGALEYLLREGENQKKDGVFPLPTTPETLNQYLDWDDWRVFGEITAGNCGDHGECIKNRRHDRCVWSTGEVPTADELQTLEEYQSRLGKLITFISNSSKSWYSLGSQQDLLIVPDGFPRPEQGAPLSDYSNVVRNLTPSSQRGIFVRLEDRQRA